MDLEDLVVCDAALPVQDGTEVQRGVKDTQNGENNGFQSGI
jgi:hypothetical protein